MKLVFDSDGLIKLHRSGALELVTRIFPCLVPAAVYRETVTSGKDRQYADAEEIDQIIKASMTLHSEQAGGELGPGLGSGETDAFRVAINLNGECLIVTDDRRFQAFLMRQGVPFLTPPALVIELVQNGVVTTEEARDCLDRMRPLIQRDSYQAALQDLEFKEVEE